MNDDREQERDEEGGEAARPSGASARRERRASTRATASATTAKGRATPARDGKGSKQSIVRRLARFIREVVAELRKVIWPRRKQMVTYTLVVLVFLICLVAVVAGLDQLFARVMLWVFG